MVVNEDLYKYFKQQIFETEIMLPYIDKYKEQHMHGLLQFPSLFNNVEAPDLGNNITYRTRNTLVVNVLTSSVLDS